MARRKRASMREGPLADLFRSTSDEPSQEPPEFEPQQEDDISGPQGDPVEPVAETHEAEDAGAEEAQNEKGKEAGAVWPEAEGDAETRAGTDNRRKSCRIGMRDLTHSVCGTPSKVIADSRHASCVRLRGYQTRVRPVNLIRSAVS